MKKTLIALAAVAAATGAVAQNVELYGRIDLGHANTKVTSSTGETKSKSLAGDQGAVGQNRLGVRGSEDLGGGLRASFNYEMGLNPDATGSAVASTRTAIIGLSGGFGGITIGTFLNGTNTVRGFRAGIDGVPGGDFLSKHVNAAAGMTTKQIADNFGSLGMAALPATADFVVTKIGTTSTIANLATAQVTILDGVVSGTAVTIAAAGLSHATSYGAAYVNATTANATLGVESIAAMTPAEAAALLATLRTAATANAAQAAKNVAAGNALASLLRNGAGPRSENSIAYTSPTFNGLTIGVGMFDDSSVATVSGAKGNEVKGSGQSLTLTYTGGPLRAALSHSTAKFSSNSATVAQGLHAVTVTGTGESSAKTEGTVMAVSYNLGFATPYVQYEITEGKLNKFQDAAITGTGVKTKAYEIGSKFTMGAFTPYVTFGKGEVKTTASGTQTSDTDTSSYQIGTTYALSKRTSLYAGVGQFKQKTSTTQRKESGYKLGLVHTF